MTTEDIILHIFCFVDDRLGHLPKHPQAKLYPSEIVTIGILFALKGGSFRAFYRWLKRDFGTLFGERGLPDRTRLLRQLKVHARKADSLLAEPSFFTVIDSYPIELLFPVREGRSGQQVGKKGLDKGRWIVGIKLCWLINSDGQVVAWDWATANTYDKHFLPLVEPFQGKTIVLADQGFRDANGIPEHVKICKKGTWNERMMVETVFSMVTQVCGLKHIRHRLSDYIHARLSFVTAMFNVLTSLHRQLHPNAAKGLQFALSIAEFSL